jgi:hypothetical protein
MSRSPRRRLPPIRITPEVYRQYRDSIALNPPETFALLGGHLDDPFLVTEFRFCPPQRTTNGSYDASSVHINVDHELMNYIIDFEWKPAGKYCLGIWHSHPGNSTQPSVGDDASNTGDIAFFSSCLDNDDSPDRAWRYFLAPITTFADDRDQVHGWVLRRGSRTPERCHVIVDPSAAPGHAAMVPEFAPLSPPPLLAPLFLTSDRLSRHQPVPSINAALRHFLI